MERQSKSEGAVSVPSRRQLEQDAPCFSPHQEHILKIIDSCKKENDHIGVKCLQTSLDLLKCLGGDGHSSVQMRFLDSLASQLKKQVTAGQHATTEWFSTLASTMDYLLWSQSWEPKVMKKVLKVLSELECHGPTILKELISERGSMLERPMGRLELNIWSGLLDSSALARMVVANRLTTLIDMLNHTLETVLTAQAWTLDKQVLLHMAVKVSLQIIQYLPQEVTQMVWTPSSDRIQSSKLVSSFQSLLSYIISLLSLQSQQIPRDCVLLAGMAVAFLVSLEPVSEQSNKSGVIHQIICSLGTNAKIPVGHLHLIFTAAKENQSHHMNTFGHLSMLNGLLACGEERLLWTRVKCRSEDSLPPANTESEVMLLWCFKLICDLCLQTDFQYHSFQLLLLWFKKVSQNLSTLYSLTGVKHFCQESLMVEASSELVWTHLDSPVDGVSDCAMEVFSQILKLHQQETTLQQNKSPIFSTPEILGSDPKSTQFSSSDSQVESVNTICDIGPSENAGVRDFGSKTTDRDSHENFQQLQTPTVTKCLENEYKGDDKSDSFASSLALKVMRMSWQVKGKVGLLAVLLKYMGPSEFFSSCGDVWNQLLECMGTNYLAPATTDLYRAIVMSLGDEDSNGNQSSWCDKWRETCMSHLMRGLTSHNSLLRHNISHHWLPWTFKHIPGAFPLLKTHLESILLVEEGVTRDQILFAIVVVLRVARGQQLLDLLPMSIVREAVFHIDHEVRQDAFTLLCTTAKKSEPITNDEISLIREALPYNMNMDLAPFRQQLQANLRSLLVRARDSAIAAVKLVAKEEKHYILDQLKRTIDFIDWLWNLCLSSLHPGSSYQRHKTSLDWVLAILDTMTYQPHRRQRKGITPEVVTTLVSYAQHRGQWNFFSHDNTHVILVCLLHGTDEIREMAGEILLQFFPWPVSLMSEIPDGDALSQLLAHALDLCTSPKAQDAESGALLCKIIFQRHVVDQGDVFHMHVGSSGCLEVHRECPCSNNDEAAVTFIRQLVNLITEANRTAQENILTAARQAPAHGFILAVQRCLTECGLKFVLMNLWQPVFVKLIYSVSDILGRVLHILGGRQSEDGSAPSFEQMSTAIGEVIAESMESGLYEEDTILSGEHQLIMTWCWINIREGSVLLGRLVENLARMKRCLGVLDVAQVTDLGNTFIKILTQCRHRGAIEGCNLGFLRYCTALLQSSHPQLHNIPGTLLSQVLSQVTSIGAKVSVTRRSAGLPLIVQSIVASESKTKQNSLLSKAVTNLLDILAEPVPDDPDQQRDLPHIHAINILKTVFRESSVAMALVPHFATAMMSAIDGFSSPFWAIRNASTQLFGTLISRMLGQQKTRDDQLNTTTAPEFFAHYSILEPFLLSHLQQACLEHRQGQLTLHPSLFPVLSILAKLGPGVQQTSSLTEFREAVLLLAGSAIYAVRELAASALIPLVSKVEVGSVIGAILESVPACPSGLQSFNYIHGSLLQIEKLLRCSTLIASNEQHIIMESLLSRKWLGTALNPCNVVQAKYLQVVTQAMKTFGYPLNAEFHMGLRDEMMNLLSEEPTKQFMLVGRDRLSQQLVEGCLEYHSVDLNWCLHCADVEVVLGTLKHLDAKLIAATHQELVFWEHAQELLFGMLLHQQPWAIQCGALSLIIAIHTKYDVCSTNQQGAALMEKFVAMIQKEANCEPSFLAVTASAILLKKHGCDFFRTELESWSKMILDCSQPASAEGLRLHAAQALQIAGSPLLEAAYQGRNTQLSSVAVSIFHSTLSLLVDDQPQVREQAAIFVTKLTKNTPSNTYCSIHSSVAIQVFCLYMSSKFSWFPVVILGFWETYDMGNPLHDVIGAELCRKRYDLFEPEDVNPFLERVVLIDAILNNIQRGMESSDCVLLMGCKATAKLSGHIESMAGCLESLQTHCENFGIFNITGEKTVYEALHLSLQVAAHCLWILGDHEFCDEMRDAATKYITTFSKIAGIHPGLKMLAWRVLSQLPTSAH